VVNYRSRPDWLGEKSRDIALNPALKKRERNPE
jgi:hypothetical protein